MVVTQNEDEALRIMRNRNQARRGRTDLAVIVDGPEDGEFSVMSLREAVDGGFGYRWEV